MADMRDFGEMNINDRGGKHEFRYEDGEHIPQSEGATPSQTVGPYFAYGLTPGAYGYPHEDIHSATIAPPDASDDAITVEGQIYDGAGQPVHDAMVEIIQADASGRYATSPRNDGFSGFGRCGTGPNGPAEKGGDTHFRFNTIKPGASSEGAAPFLTAIVTMRGLLNHCITRVYFPEDDIASDPVMKQVPDARKDTLIAKKITPGRYRFDIYMQGKNETVFFDI